MIYLNAQVNSDLNWNVNPPENDIRWELDLGLFHRLPKPLSDESQFHTLELALDHFTDTIWKKYPQTKDVCIYKGPAIPDLIWDDNLEKHFQEWKQNNSDSIPLFCFDVGSRYLRMLTDCLPDEMPLSIDLDFSGIESPMLKARLSQYERFPMNPPGDEKIAVCLPERAIITPEMEAAVPKNARFVSESRLTLEWKGLDQLIVFPRYMNPQGMRKLQGFMAAGGEVINIQ